MDYLDCSYAREIINKAARSKQTEVSLGHLQLTELPSEISELKDLTSLILSDNRLTKLPPEITELKKLTSLGLRINLLSELPSEVTELENLTNLDLSDNKLMVLPAEIGLLENLTTLGLRINQLKKLPSEIAELSNLKILIISDNQLTELPSRIAKLKNLEFLFLNGNQLTELPIEISELKNLKKLDLSDNPLKFPPPEIVKQGKDAIFEYLRKHQEAKQAKTIVERNEAKLILVGEGNTGKTTLAERLIYNTFDETKRTEGIEIFEWELETPEAGHPEIQLNVWDFGGQEIYKATHQFFLTERSVYLLVWNGRDSTYNDQLYKWLRTIETFGKDSPVLLVMTKLDEHLQDVNLANLRRKFPNIKGTFKIECSRADGGADGLRERIREIVWELPHMRTDWLPEYEKVRLELSSLAEDGTNWIECDRYNEICSKAGLDKKNTAILDKYLHDLGVIIHFRDNQSLKNMLILSPEWATKAVYKVLDTRKVKENEGILLPEDPEIIWDSDVYPLAIHDKLLELMNAFELAYRLPEGGRYLVAEHLPASDPEEFVWDYSDNLRFIYEYDFLPDGVMTRFIVRAHEDLEIKEDGLPYCWKEGAVLQDKKARAFVKSQKEERSIEINVSGNRPSELLAIIRNHFDHINHTFNKIKIDKLVPCPEDGCPYLFNYDDIIKAGEKGRKSIPCSKSWEDIPLAKLLDGYVPRVARKGGGEIIQVRNIYNHYGDEIDNRKNVTNNTTNISTTFNIKTINKQLENQDILDKIAGQNEELKSFLQELNENVLADAFFEDNQQVSPKEVAGKIAEQEFDEDYNLPSIGSKLKERLKELPLEIPLDLLKGAAGAQLTNFLGSLAGLF